MEAVLILFYLGSRPDHRGRSLAEILEQDDLWFETVHDFIQWLFPNREHSRVNPHAPNLTPEVISAFNSDELLKRQLRASFNRMLAFYGLRDSGHTIKKADNWPERKTDWFTRDTHNNLRITRIIKCLNALGLENEAERFHAALHELRISEPDCGIGDVAFRFWDDAQR